MCGYGSVCLDTGGARATTGACAALWLATTLDSPCGIATVPPTACDLTARLQCGLSSGHTVCLTYSDGGAGGACDYDFGCDAGLACTFDSPTQLGVCLAPASDGDPCVRGLDCASGLCSAGHCLCRD